MKEFCVGYPIECDPEPVSGVLGVPWYNATQDWWGVRMGSLRARLREAYDDWKTGTLGTRGAAARSQIESLHTYEIVGAAMRSRLTDIHELIRSGSCRPELAATWAGQVPE